MVDVAFRGITGINVCFFLSGVNSPRTFHEYHDPRTPTSFPVDEIDAVDFE